MMRGFRRTGARPPVLTISALLAAIAITAIAVLAPATEALAQQLITFEDLEEGAIPDSVMPEGGGLPVGIDGFSPAFGADTNAAVVFDSSCDPKCTGNDKDLGTPNEVAVADGPGVGEAGESGPFVNDTEQGMVLIIGEDLVDEDPENDLVDDPDDGQLVGSALSFDFSAYGTVTIHALTIIDVEGIELPAVIEFVGPGDTPLGDIVLPQTGNNGVKIFDDFEPVSGVEFMNVVLNGSGAIDDIYFERDGTTTTTTPVTTTTSTTFPYECRVDDDCTDSDTCTIDECRDNECVNQRKQCTDENPCTEDRCGEDGECEFTPINCDDQDPCTRDYCGRDGKCHHELIDCNDGDACTLDACYLGECINKPKSCDDQDACTIDRCGDDGKCYNRPIDCDDQEECTVDRCVEGSCKHRYTCSTTTTSTTTTTTMPYYEGCTPGYWKNHDDWPAPLDPDDDFDETFDVDLFDDDLTLMQSLKYGGGGILALARHAVAALLSANHPDVAYSLSPADVLLLVKLAVLSGDEDTIEKTKDDLDDYNNQGCPLGNCKCECPEEPGPKDASPGVAAEPDIRVH